MFRTRYYVILTFILFSTAASVSPAEDARYTNCRDIHALSSLHSRNGVMLAEIEPSGTVASERKVVLTIQKHGALRPGEFNQLISIPCLTDLQILTDAVSEDELLKLGHLRRLRRVHLQSEKASDEVVRRIAMNRDLEELTVAGMKLTGSSFADYIRHPHIRYLEISNSPITEAGVSYLGRIKGLKVLTLTNCGITDDCLSGLKDSQSIGGLYLRDNQISGRGLRYLAALPLEALDLQWSCITDAELATVRKWPSTLSHLSLSHSRVRNLGLVCLFDSENSTLRHLSVDYTLIKGDSIQHLLRASHLEFLDLSGTRIQAKELEALDALKHLCWLSIRALNLADSDLRFIVGLDSVQDLDLSANNRLTENCVEHLIAMKSLRRVHGLPSGIIVRARNRAQAAGWGGEIQ